MKNILRVSTLIGFILIPIFLLYYYIDLKKNSLYKDRENFKTEIVDISFEDDDKPATPPKGVLDLIYYPAKDGDMAAFITPDPKDEKKHPAVIWLVGGYGGIGSDDYFWRSHPRSNDQSASAFRKAGIVTMIPSFRGENGNPGKYEMFYGELDDLENAREYLSKLPYVDPDRIYLVGHSTGGTRALLASELPNKYRAIFSLGGIPDLKKRVDMGPISVDIPFNQNNQKEFRLRSPGHYISSITTPTFYFEGGRDIWPEFYDLKKQARNENIPLHIYSIKRGDHFNIIIPTTELIAKKILLDKGETSNIKFSPLDIMLIETKVKTLR
ncbi:alpha/beta hydrolase family protein [Escherichia coli]|uniref:alpha/beta hydrolase family protein n=1 Tax=Escherichia coli TaxID=562 RepID=UPI001FCF0970|nr:prolyl oligopeptidase family serine peptidase [Escherichia coli]